MQEPERVAVLGLGDFGYHLACELYQLGHEVLAVDSNQDKVQQILPYVTKAAVADVSDQAALQELGIASFDLVAVCVGERLETAVLLVYHLHQWKLPRILVKVANDEQAEIVTGRSHRGRPPRAEQRPQNGTPDPSPAGRRLSGAGRRTPDRCRASSCQRRRQDGGHHGFSGAPRGGPARAMARRATGPAVAAGSRSHDCRDRRLDPGGAYRPAASVAEDAMRLRGEQIGAEV